MGQKAQLWWDLPAGDGFLLLREIYQMPKDRFQANLDALVAALRIEDKLNIQIRRLSLGERMKMELIAALLHQPRVVFLDEPTIGLDLTAQRAIREFLLEYRRKESPAMILTSHYMEDIEKLCKRIVLVAKGEIVYDGSVAAMMAELCPAQGPDRPPARGRASAERRRRGAVRRCRNPSARWWRPAAQTVQIKVPRGRGGFGLGLAAAEPAGGGSRHRRGGRGDGDRGHDEAGGRQHRERRHGPAFLRAGAEEALLLPRRVLDRIRRQRAQPVRRGLLPLEGRLRGPRRGEPWRATPSVPSCSTT